MQVMLGTSPEMVVILRQSSFGLLLSVYHSVAKASDPDGSLIYARPIGQVYTRELRTADPNHPAAGADSSAIMFTQPEWNFSETEKQMREAFEKVYDPENSTFLRYEAIDSS